MSEVPSGWSSTTIGASGHLASRRPKPFKDKRPYIATADLVGGRIRPSEIVSFAARPARADLELRPGDVLQAKMKATNKALLVGSEQSGWLASTGFAQFSPLTAGNDPAYFFHLVSSARFHQLKDALCVGSTQQAISDRELAAIRVVLPPRDEQTRISDVLNTIDEAIHTTERVIAKLQQMKRGILQDLFTRGIADNGELRDPRRQPEQFRVTQLGLLPTSWTVRPLGSAFRRLTYGFTCPMPSVDEGPLLLTAADVGYDDIHVESARRTTRRAFDLLSEKCKPAVGDVLVTKDGTIGRVAVLSTDDVCVNQSVAVLQPKDPEHARFLADYLLSPHGQAAMLADTGGSTIKHIYITRLAKMPVAIPERHEATMISQRVRALNDRLREEGAARHKLNLIRNGVRTDLLSGRVRVEVTEGVYG